jgi:hypothetical protein
MLLELAVPNAFSSSKNHIAYGVFATIPYEWPTS